MIPQTENISHKDVLDAIISACQKPYKVEQPDHTYKEELGLDYEAMWWKTHKVASVTFARFAKVFKVLELKADQCKFHMTSERAEVMEAQLRNICIPYKISTDAKSSESRLNKQNRQQTLIDTLSNNKSERVVSLKEEGGRSLKEAILGKEKEVGE